MKEKIGVIGLGYVGLPLVLAFAKKHPGTIGFDINQERVDQLRQGFDKTNETSKEELSGKNYSLTSDINDLKDCTFYVVTVPTPIDDNHKPDKEPLRSACEYIAKVLSKGDVVVFESTVYPGLTEEECGPWLEEYSGLKQSVDFKLGYSPERINPGDKEHSLETIVKVISGEDDETLDRVAKFYEEIVVAGVHRATSIKVAEASKVIENTQRDLNIALMNELSYIFDNMGIRTQDVLDAAGTKWNFLPFTPGLVGGHCIGIDPYYLTTKAQSLGYEPKIILAARGLNDKMGNWVGQKTIEKLLENGVDVKGAKIAVLGLTFKENVPDLRNTRVLDIIEELKDSGVEVYLHEPVADKADIKNFYDIDAVNWDDIQDMDGIILAVSHNFYKDITLDNLVGRMKPKGVLVDIKSIFNKKDMPDNINYWSL